MLFTLRVQGMHFHVADPSLLDLVKQQFTRFVSDTSHKVVMEVLRAFVRIMSVVSNELRQTLIVPTLETATAKVRGEFG